jgi:Ig-like domain-containing protein/Big-like domain-containing protein
MNHRVGRYLRFLFLVLSLTSGCSLFSPDKPIVVIESPPSGSQFHEGELISVQSASSDRSAVVRVELVVDGNIADVDPSPTAKGQPSFTLVQQWKGTQGQHVLMVRAYNGAGQMSDPVAVSVTVLPASAQSSVPPPTAASATNTPTATPTTAPPPPAAPAAGCNNNAGFVADVTIPDGSTINPGQAFTKIWRMINSGTCTWGPGYQFVFVSGEAMTASSAVPVPTTAPGATADLAVPMTGPATPGTHVGKWQMRAGSSLFGQAVNVTINVPAPPPPPPPPAGCSGTPNIASFTADKTTIFAGSNVTLSWGAVTNADSVEIDQGIGGVATPGSTSVFVNSTKTFTMTAHCGSNSVSKQVTVKFSPLIITIPPGLLVLHVTSSNAYVILQVPCIGSASQTVNFAADVTVNLAGTVKYRWEYSDGTNDGTQQVVFASGGTQQILATHSFSSSGWAKVNFISPDDPDSNKATFSKSCISFPFP